MELWFFAETHPDTNHGCKTHRGAQLIIHHVIIIIIIIIIIFRVLQQGQRMVDEAHPTPIWKSHPFTAALIIPVYLLTEMAGQWGKLNNQVPFGSGENNVDGSWFEALPVNQRIVYGRLKEIEASIAHKCRQRRVFFSGRQINYASLIFWFGTHSWCNYRIRKEVAHHYFYYDFFSQTSVRGCLWNALIWSCIVISPYRSLFNPLTALLVLYVCES